MAGIYDAATFERWNIINQVIPDEILLKETLVFAKRLAEGPTRAHASTKTMLRAFCDHGVSAADAVILLDTVALFETENMQGGVARILEKGLARATARKASRAANVAGPHTIVPQNCALHHPLVQRRGRDLVLEQGRRRSHHGETSPFRTDSSTRTNSGVIATTAPLITGRAGRRSLLTGLLATPTLAATLESPATSAEMRGSNSDQRC
jgi:hypothetical protein